MNKPEPGVSAEIIVARGAELARAPSGLVLRGLETLRQREAGLTRFKVNPVDGAAMVFVQAGEFTMGSNDYSEDEKPVHKVHLDGYWIYKNDVTVAMYQKFCAVTTHAMPSAPPWGWKDDHPMVKVSWFDAQAYCQWAGTSLPTEAQWEKAARGTDGRKFSWGDDFDATKLQCSKTSLGDAGSTAPAGSFPGGASPFGCLDMAGNVWQWCSDWYDEKYYASSPSVNPNGPPTGRLRVLRGGSWNDAGAGLFRCSYRSLLAPGYLDSYFLGFRCVEGPR